VLGDADRTGSTEEQTRAPVIRERPPADGAIPFRIRIGVTGHVDLIETEALVDVLRGRIRVIREELPFAGDEWRNADRHPLVRLAVVSQLARGADRLVVREVFGEAASREEEARLEVILPMNRDAYAREQDFSDEDRGEFDALLNQAVWKYEPKPGDEPVGESPYRAAGRQMLARCDVLVALWDGEPSRGPGGTAETLLDAAWHGRPCIWIKADASSVYDNFTTESLGGEDFYEMVENAAAVPRPIVASPAEAHEDEQLRRERLAEDLRKPVRESFRRLERFNHARVATGLEADAAEELGSDPDFDASWVAASFARAAAVAGRAQRRFEHLAGAILVFGAMAALLLALNVLEISGEHEPMRTLLEVAEFGCLVLALVLFWHTRHAEHHARWLSTRVLAERLRSAYHVAPTGADFPRVATLEHVYIERFSREWVQRAVEEVWDRRPQESVPSMVEVRRFVVQWIDGQIRYHRRNARRHARLAALLTPWVVGLFCAAALCAGVRLLPLLHVLHLPEWLRNLFLAATIALPAFAAALGAWLTIAQHHALHVRYEGMEADLAGVLHDVRDADEDRLGEESLRAASVISDEGGDWLGTMWFLDVEHP
jgi:hypothetical protein